MENQQTPPPDNYAPRPAKDRSLALILEIIPALFGIFGIGWIYAGNTTAGIIWLISVLIWDAIVIAVVLFTGGIACFCTVPINLALIAISAMMLNNYTKEHTELFRS